MKHLIEDPDAQDPENTHHSTFDISSCLHALKHYLPAQAPLKDFVHHNTLHAFQNLKFDEALNRASMMFGSRTFMSLKKFRALYDQQQIRDEVLERVIINKKGEGQVREWKEKLLFNEYRHTESPRIGGLRASWKKVYHIDLDSLVHTTLFRIVCSYLDQGIAIWSFPIHNKGFLASVREMERHSFTSFFRTKHVRSMLIEGAVEIEDLLNIIVGDESIYQQYLFDQQFAHQGWSGIVSVVEDHPYTMIDRKNISLKEFILLELLLELDALYYLFGEKFNPLSKKIRVTPPGLFEPVSPSELQEVLFLWQEAFEWSYYDEILAAIHAATTHAEPPHAEGKSFQALFCLDDRASSFRRYLEITDPKCETFGTPGYFNVEFYFQPEHGKFFTKLCPAPMKPKHLIKELGTIETRKSDPHFQKNTQTLFRGWLISQTLGFWSAFKLFLNIFRPSASPATASSFSHMDKVSQLTIAYKNPDHKENDLQIGFTKEEMATRVEGLLKSIGMVKEFAPLVYIVGHGSSSVNNPHYAAYDCGACSGRPGSVNARVICYMANDAGVRNLLKEKGIDIPLETQFVGGLHDTTRDEIAFYDEDSLMPANITRHQHHVKTFATALMLNAKERSRRFESINTKANAAEIHEKVKRRSVSLFEPRPEYNHATNAICVVGRRALTRDLFLDRRAFLNSYDYRIDPDGTYLFNILKAAAPVCGGINLEYFFSRVDNQKLGAGSKLPHNVMGLFGVANGIEGDLRPGLPGQMVEIHDPVRLVTIVEHYPEVVQKIIGHEAETYEWFINEWIHLVVIHPDTKGFFVFRSGKFYPYIPLAGVKIAHGIETLIEAYVDNIPVHLMS
jgi:uncharacterized protein YbcC (UPF0753/DUF2309 family)